MARTSRHSVVGLLRDWRQRRHISQLDLAGMAGVSARHLSFIETGRSRPSSEMVLHLAEHLEVPLRERNALLHAAGFAPAYRSTDFDADDMKPVRDALQRVLSSHDPYPALAVDRLWNLVAANNGALMMTAWATDQGLLEPPVNVLRLALHPDGLAGRIANFDEWSAHLLQRLRRQVVLTGDRAAGELLDELRAYPGVVEETGHGEAEGPGLLAVPLRIRADDAGTELAFISTVTTFGTALDITLAELAIEAFLPADAATAAALHEG